jgi:hypothetical protein
LGGLAGVLRPGADLNPAIVLLSVPKRAAVSSIRRTVVAAA